MMRYKYKYIAKSKLLKTVLIIVLFFSSHVLLFSQNVGINVTGQTPSVNAILDLNTGNPGNLGLIIPNVPLTALTTFGLANAATAGDKGMMVYNTNGTVGNGVGYYYWNGTAWGSVNQTTIYLTACGLAAGNYIPYFTSPSTLCNSSIYFISAASDLGIGTITPKNTLDVYGGSAIGKSYAGDTAAPTNGLIVQGQVGIGTSAPDASAQLDITSSSQGLLIPRLATAPTPGVTSLLYYNTTTNSFMFYNGSAWQVMVSTCSAAPSAPGAISGATSFCVNSTGNTYSVTPVAGANSYTWTVPTTLGTIATGQGTNAITVNGAASGSGTMSVTATNSCGTSAASSLTFTVNPLPTAFTITQTNTFASGYACPGATATFSTATVAGTTYAWSVFPATCAATTGATTSNTATVTAGTGASGIVSCIESNGCGATAENFTLNTSTSHGTETYTYVANTVQTFKVPSCVTTLTIVATSGAGGTSDDPAGPGVTVTAVVSVVSGNTLDIVVGGQGNSTSWGCGGGGGSFVWDNAITRGTGYPLVVAGGGGGSGGYGLNGGLPGGYTLYPTASPPTYLSAGGTNGAAGTVGGGTGPGGAGAGWFTNTGVAGGAKPGYGGNGWGTSGNFHGGSGATDGGADGGYGGGGGGGYYGNGPYGGGGGGGGFNGASGGYSSSTQNTEYGGGGGGSGYYKGTSPYNKSAEFVNPLQVVINGTTTSGYYSSTSGNGSVVISW